MAEAGKWLRCRQGGEGLGDGFEEGRGGSAGRVAIGMEQWAGRRPSESLDVDQADDVRAGEFRPASATRPAGQLTRQAHARVAEWYGRITRIAGKPVLSAP